MTREVAIEIIQKLIGRFKSDSRTYKALEMAIKALSQEPTNEKELNKAYTFGHNKGVKAYYNEQLCTVELPEAVFEYILSLVPTEETEQEPCDDAISRDAVIKGIEELKKSPWATANRSHGYEYLITEALDIVKDLCIKQEPSVTQKSETVTEFADRCRECGAKYGKLLEQKSGKWGASCTCSVCGQWRILESEKNGGKYKYCPNCGAKMESEAK